MQRTNFRQQFTDIADACALAQGIVDTVREPVLVLDKELRVIAASRSFYSAFKVSPEDTQGRLLYALGDGQWDIPKLRVLLEKIIPEHGVMEGYEVEHEFPDLGHRTMCLNARQVFYEGGADTTILLGMEDVTERRILEREKDELLRQKDVLLEELQHRIANSLQIIASIILMKARTVKSEETRLHLQDAHKRVISVAAVQKQLHASGASGPIEIAPYLSRLCETLATSMIGDTRPISLKVVGEGGSATSRQAESLGLIVTELVMNALKHAFPDDKADGQIVVAYESPERIGSFRFPTMGLASRTASSLKRKPDSAPASSRRFQISSMPRSRLWPTPRARPCRSRTPRSRRRQSEPREGTSARAKHLLELVFNKYSRWAETNSGPNAAQTGKASRVITLTKVRELNLSAAASAGRPLHLSAASGLVCLNSFIYVVADDELHLGVFRSTDNNPGLSGRPFRGRAAGFQGGSQKAKA